MHGISSFGSSSFAHKTQRLGLGTSSGFIGVPSSLKKPSIGSLSFIVFILLNNFVKFPVHGACSGVRLSVVHLGYPSPFALSSGPLSFRRRLPTVIERRYHGSISLATPSYYILSPLPAIRGFRGPSEAVHPVSGRPSPASQFPSPFLSQEPN